MSIVSGPKIIEDGLVLYFDAANQKSYPLTGTVWFDLSGNNYNGVIANGPVFENTFLGGINCDPVNDFLYVNNTFNFLDYITIDLVYRRDSNLGSIDNIIYNKEDSWELRDLNGDLSWAIRTSNVVWFWKDTGYDVAIGETLQVTLTYDGSSIKTYVNGSLIESYVGNYSLGGGGVLNKPTTYPKLNSRGSNMTSWSQGGDHTFFNFKIYNRALTVSEVKQNFEANRGRYGI
jgi:hypothetical protein